MEKHAKPEKIKPRKKERKKGFRNYRGTFRSL